MTITFRDGDVGALLRDMLAIGAASPVSINGVSGIGIVEENDQIVVTNGGRGEVVGGMHTVLVQTSQYPAIEQDMPMVVDGKSYTVRQKLESGDSAVTKILLGSV